MVRFKELSVAIRQMNVAAYEHGKGFKETSQQLEINRSTVWKIVNKFRTFHHPCRSTLRAECNMLQEVSKTPEMSWQDLG